MRSLSRDVGATVPLRWCTPMTPRFPHSRIARLLGLLMSVALPACQKESSDPAPAPAASTPAETRVLLQGSFERVAKHVTGSVALIEGPRGCQLRLRDVTVDNLGEVQIYFVGLPEAKSTLALTAVETKYDFGPLQQGAHEQLIDLPGKPAPELRSVVLYEPRYRVNLAAAALK